MRSVTSTDVFHSTILWLGGQMFPLPGTVPHARVGAVRSILIVIAGVAVRWPATSTASPWTVWTPSAVIVHEAVAVVGPYFGLVPVCGVVVVTIPPLVAGQI